MALLKDLYLPAFYHQFARILGQTLSSFNEQRFIQNIFDKDWKNKEFKQRMKHTSLVLGNLLPHDFKKAAPVLKQIILQLRKNGVKEQSVEYMFLPDFIENFGMDHFEVSVSLMEFVTQFTSCEFAIRPFIIRYQDKMIKEMIQWSTHRNEHVRRLASEGSRPRLPWAMAIPALKKNPEPILPILENLKNDSSEYVRRSVANNLNDIAKDHPGLVIALAKKWKGISPQADAVIKHGCRTLLKKGNREIFEYYKLNGVTTLKLSNFKVLTRVLSIGGYLEFSFDLQNGGKSSIPLRIEYAIHYLLNNGKHSKKVFKICERSLQPGTKLPIRRKHSFKIISTRKFYTGTHKVNLILNGKEQKASPFELCGS